MIGIKTNIAYDNWKLKSFLMNNWIAYSSSYSDVVFILPSLKYMMILKSLWGKFPIPVEKFWLSSSVNPNSNAYKKFHKWFDELDVSKACTEPVRSIREDEEYSPGRKHWKIKDTVYE